LVEARIQEEFVNVQRFFPVPETESFESHRRVEWRARDLHPWDYDLSTQRQAQLFARQCLKDVDAAITRLFERVPEMHVLEIVVRAPRSEAVLMSGVVHRDDLREASHLALQK
jgi:hypothetical protein